MSREDIIKELTLVYKRTFELNDMRLCLEILQEITRLKYL